MPIIPKVLAEGQLPASKGTLFTATTTVYLKYFRIANTSGSLSQTILIYIKPGSTSRRNARIVLVPNGSADVVDKDDAISLESGDTIEGETTNASTVDFIITGATG